MTVLIFESPLESSVLHASKNTVNGCLLKLSYLFLPAESFYHIVGSKGKIFKWNIFTIIYNTTKNNA